MPDYATWDDPILLKHLQMKRGLSFTIPVLLGLLASVAMAMDNNWPAAALGCLAAGGLFGHGNPLACTPTLAASIRNLFRLFWRYLPASITPAGVSTPHGRLPIAFAAETTKSWLVL